MPVVTPSDEPEDDATEAKTESENPEPTVATPSLLDPIDSDPDDPIVQDNSNSTTLPDELETEENNDVPLAPAADKNGSTEMTMPKAEDETMLEKEEPHEPPTSLEEGEIDASSPVQMEQQETSKIKMPNVLPGLTPLQSIFVSITKRSRLALR